ncbi:MAG: DegT/DnrJ/EryC1/StrS family aminotransferase [Lachnospiraceae bacterium]|nr:DegT/DnrJ/EryC1/StrS family aminotransferase [Lachnospiraceae bacterium]
MKIECNRLDKGFELFQSEYESKALEVLRSGWYILGRELEAFEEEFSKYNGVRYCLGVGNGLDALQLAVKALEIGVGDEVIVQGNTYIASVMGITMNGATPVFVEPDIYGSIDADRIEEKINSNTKAIMVVHLYGMPCDMEKVMSIAKKYKLRVIEDCAQSHGAEHKGKVTGTFGDIGCFSFYPTKNLGAFGDGGAIITNDSTIYDRIKILRNYGSDKKYHNKEVGYNSRLDEIQAGLLRVKLRHLNELISRRRIIANRYLAEIKNDNITMQQVRVDTNPVWHQFVIRTSNRDELIKYLGANEINTIIHYPVPPHLSEAYKYLKIEKGRLPITEKFANEVLSLPMYDGMVDEEVTKVIEIVNSWKNGELYG